MVEFTLPIVLQIVQTVALLVGIVYYLTIMRNQQRTQQMQLENRQVQFLIEYNQVKVETMKRDFPEVMSAEWTDFDDWYNKYGVHNNPDNYEKRDRLWESYHINGLLIRDGMINIETYIDYNGDTPVLMWEKYKDIIKELRIRVSLPTYMIGFEILADEITKYRMSKGWGHKKNELELKS